MYKKVILAVIVAAAFWGGGQTVYIAVANSKPTTISVKDYLSKRPGVHWLNLTGGRLDFRGALLHKRKGSGTIKNLYIPYVAPGMPATTRIYVKTNNDELVSLFTKKGISKLKSSQRTRLALKWGRPQTVSGLVQVGINTSSSIEKQIQKVSGKNSKLIILELGGKPAGIAVGIIMLLVGFGALAYLVVVLKRKA